jgi:hypothetical protein
MCSHSLRRNSEHGSKKAMPSSKKCLSFVSTTHAVISHGPLAKQVFSKMKSLISQKKEAEVLGFANLRSILQFTLLIS